MKFLRNTWRAIKGFFPWYAHLYKGRPWYTKTAVGIVSTIVAFFLYLGMVDVNFLWLFGKSPGFMEIQEPPTFAASEIYSSDGKLIGKYFKENRTPVQYEQVNPVFWKALVDTEDERFYSHHGVDFLGLGGAVKDALLHSGARGASTITQQLAKNMFSTRSQSSTGLLGKVPGVRMLIMKSKEWIVATKLEFVYSKEQILTMYANTVDFGNNSFGIMTAAKTYYDCKPSQLTPDQCATLVGMLKATTSYNPISHPKNSMARRNTVLYNMVTHGDMSQSDYERYSKRELGAELHVEEYYGGKALYFREAVSKYLDPWLKENGYDLYSAGLKIYTTIDLQMQEYAEQAVKKQMEQIQRNFDRHWYIHRDAKGWNGMNPWCDETGKELPGFIEEIAQRLPVYRALQQRFPNNPDSVLHYLNKPHMVKLFDYERGSIEKEMSTLDSIRYMVSFMHTGLVAMEPQTGAVRAWVGDIDFESWKYDKVTTERQPGSTFKLFVYTEAMNQGVTPCDKRRDEYIQMEVLDKKTGEYNTWRPTNANGRFSGDSVTLKRAFAQSINSIAVKLGQEMGIPNIIRTAQDMGITSPLADEPSLALGSSDVNLLDLTDSYCTVANDGKHHSPVLVTRIVDKDGNEIYHGPDDQKQAIPYRSAFFMQELLKGGRIEPRGTSMSLNHYIQPNGDTDWGGKTGTSNNHADAWFMAVSPKLVVGCWVGGEYRSIHFRTGALGQGSKTALPVCGEFIKMLHADARYHEKYKGKWPAPDPDEIEASTYQCVTSVVSTAKNDTLDLYYRNRRHHQEDVEEEMLDENGEPMPQEAGASGEPRHGEGDHKSKTETSGSSANKSNASSGKSSQLSGKTGSTEGHQRIAPAQRPRAEQL